MRHLNGDQLFLDEWFGSLDNLPRVMWIGMVLKMADDQGRFIHSALRIRATLFPMNDYPPGELETIIQDFIRAGKLISYQAGGCQVLQIVNWWKYQDKSSWMGPSQYPPPPGWRDCLRYHGPGNVIIQKNWTTPRQGGFNGHHPQEEQPELPSPLPSELPSPLPCRDVNGDVNGDGEVKERAALSPELRVYSQATRSLPLKSQYAFVTRFIQENKITQEMLASAWELWTAKGYNPRNVKGILEYARDARSIQGEGNGGKPLDKMTTRIFDANLTELQKAMEVAGGDQS